MTGEPTHTTPKERMAPEVMRFSSERIPKLSITDVKVKWPLCCYVHPVTQRRTVGEAPLQSIQSP